MILGSLKCKQTPDEESPRSQTAKPPVNCEPSHPTDIFTQKGREGKKRGICMDRMLFFCVGVEVLLR